MSFPELLNASVKAALGAEQAGARGARAAQQGEPRFCFSTGRIASFRALLLRAGRGAVPS